MLPGPALLIATVCQAVAAPTDQIEVRRTDQALELSWADAEDRLRGAVFPARPRAREELRVSVDVGSFEGKPYEGPVTIGLRHGQLPAQAVTVSRSGKTWSAVFLPEEHGAYQLDVSFRSTRLKQLHAPLEVWPAPLGRLPWLLLLGALAALLLGLGVRQALKPKD
ncbi:MAG: hypothetical protein HYZ28_27610 [Myxococcales bacterium]|nr:hypothetical protein [Myxococcales bacterium]